MANTENLDQVKHGKSDAPVVDIMLQRWSPRAFAEKPVSDEDLKAVFSAASWAASSYNEQPWRFLVGRKGDDTWTRISQALMAMNQAWAKSAPVLYVGLAKKTFSSNQAPNAVYIHDLGAASANASLQATALGLHTHGMGGFDRDAIRTSFAVPEDFEPVACWALGYLGDPEGLPDNLKTMELQPRVRKALSEIVFKNWGQPAL